MICAGLLLAECFGERERERERRNVFLLPLTESLAAHDLYNAITYYHFKSHT